MTLNNEDYLTHKQIGKYKLIKKIGSGSYGVIYEGTNVQTDSPVAIKISKKIENTQLKLEYEVYKVLSAYNAAHAAIAPAVHAFYKIDTANGEWQHALVLDLMGKNLENVFEENKRRFTMHTVLQIGRAALRIIEVLHRNNYIHRDIKPSNFVFGPGDDKELYIIDFGLAKKYFDSAAHMHIVFSRKKKLIGTVRYASLNAHRGYEQSRRDDLESLCYTLIYFANGSLPWQGVKVSNKKEKHSIIYKKKNCFRFTDLSPCLPKVLEEFLEYVKNLDFDEMPDYAYLKELLSCELGISEPEKKCSVFIDH